VCTGRQLRLTDSDPWRSRRSHPVMVSPMTFAVSTTRPASSTACRILRGPPSMTATARVHAWPSGGATRRTSNARTRARSPAGVPSSTARSSSSARCPTVVPPEGPTSRKPVVVPPTTDLGVGSSTLPGRARRSGWGASQSRCSPFGHFSPRRSPPRVAPSNRAPGPRPSGLQVSSPAWLRGTRSCAELQKRASSSPHWGLLMKVWSGGSEIRRLAHARTTQGDTWR